MQKEISKKPIISNRKVYIILDSDTMTKEAANCLLKTLEEPPEYATIILTSSNEEKLLNTIKSRCMKIAFEPIGDNEIESELTKIIQGNVDKELIKKSQGSLGKAILLEQDKETYKEVDIILKNIEEKSLVQILNDSEVLYKQKDKIQEILEYIEIYMYNTKEIAKLNCIECIEETKKRINANSNYDMCIDYLLMNLWEILHQ